MKQVNKIKNILLPVTNPTFFLVLTDEVSSTDRITLDNNYVIISKLYCCISYFYTCNTFLFLLESQNQEINDLEVLKYIMKELILILEILVIYIKI